jgi:hypothetical protein
MLHFLLGLALCIFIGERLWHYWWIMKLRREERREERRILALYAPQPQAHASPLSPRYEPEQRMADRRALKVFSAVFIVAASFLAIAMFGPH